MVNAYLKFSPPSEHSNNNFLSRDSTNVFKWAWVNTFHNWDSVYLLNGSILNLRVPQNTIGSFEIKY